MAYLEEFITNLDQRKHTIAEAAARVGRHGVTVPQHRALAGADLPVLPGQPDPALRWLEQRAVRWQGLRDWFVPE